jgi:hypothetical protein
VIEQQPPLWLAVHQDLDRVQPVNRLLRIRAAEVDRLLRLVEQHYKGMDPRRDRTAPPLWLAVHQDLDRVQPVNRLPRIRAAVEF